MCRTGSASPLNVVRQVRDNYSGKYSYGCSGRDIWSFYFMASHFSDTVLYIHSIVYSRFLCSQPSCQIGRGKDVLAHSILDHHSKGPLWSPSGLIPSELSRPEFS